MIGRIKIDGELYRISSIFDNGLLPLITTEEGQEFYLAKDSETAGEKAVEYWQDMKYNDREEFRCIIGEERLRQWSLGKSDSFGISSFKNFCKIVATVPEEDFASYDHIERSVDRIGRAVDELGFIPTVAYRHN